MWIKGAADRAKLPRKEAAGCAQHGHQDEGADASDGDLGIAPLLAFDADQCADQDRDGEVLDCGKVEVDVHGFFRPAARPAAPERRKWDARHILINHLSDPR